MADIEKYRIVDNEGNEVLADVSVSFQDREVFFDSVFSNTKPNENLVAAAKRYKSKHQREKKMNITEIANRIAEMHYPNKPKAMDDEILFNKWRESLGMDWNEFLEYTETMQSYIDFAKWYKENTKER